MKQEVALVAALFQGSLVAVQQRINGELGTALHDPLLAAVVSFGTGLALMSVLVLRRLDGLSRLRDVPRWTRLGGLGGATLVTVGATAAPKIGVALLTVGIVSGATVAGLALDRVGLAPGGRRPVTGPRLAGTALCLAAIALSAREGLRSAGLLLLLLVVFAGGLTSVQQALNGRVRATTDATVATFLNFVVGTTGLVVALGIQQLLGRVHADRWPSAPWMYLGGLMGCMFIALAAVVVGTLGVLRFGLAATSGQLLGGVLLDLDRGVGAITVLAVAMTLAAVAVSGIGSRRVAVGPVL